MNHGIDDVSIGSKTDTNDSDISSFLPAITDNGY